MRVSSPFPGDSSLKISAPRSESIVVQKGPARIRDKSNTRIPFNGPCAFIMPILSKSQEDFCECIECAKARGCLSRNLDEILRALPGIGTMVKTVFASSPGRGRREGQTPGPRSRGGSVLKMGAPGSCGAPPIHDENFQAEKCSQARFFSAKIPSARLREIPCEAGRISPTGVRGAPPARRRAS